MSQHGGHVAIIGSGVIGTACAYYLTEAGFQVTMLDRGEFGNACSHANCGLIVPSHILPLAMPGAVGSTLKSLFKKNSPIKIKPGLNLERHRWLLKFAGRCKTQPMLESARAIEALLESSVSLYQELIPKESLDCEWESAGCLFVFQSAKEMNHYANCDQILRDHFGMAATPLDGGQLMEKEPALKPGLAGAWYYERDSHLRPDRLLSEWRKVLQQRGVIIRENCEAKRFIGQAGSLNTIETSTGEICADAFVLATGAWTPLLNKQLGCKIPIQPGKGYSITMPRPEICPKIPLLLEEHRIAVTPMQTGYRLGSMMEFVGYDTSINPRRLELLKTGASHYLQEPYVEPVQETWYGWRPMTYDGKPIIDKSPAYENLIIAAGHNMLGLSMAPATGKLVQELLSNHQTHVDPAPYRVTRF